MSPFTIVSPPTDVIRAISEPSTCNLAPGLAVEPTQSRMWEDHRP